MGSRMVQSLRSRPRRRGKSAMGLKNAHALADTCVAYMRRRPGNKPCHLVLALAAKRASQLAGAEAGEAGKVSPIWRACHVWLPVCRVKRSFVARMEPPGPASGRPDDKQGWR